MENSPVGKPTIYETRWNTMFNGNVKLPEDTWVLPEMGDFQIILFNLIFPYKPAILRIPQDYGNLHMSVNWKNTDQPEAICDA